MSEQLKDISCVEAWNMIQSNPSTLFIDVRSSMEFLFVGHASKSIHIPWIDEPDWIVNPDFATDIRKMLLGGVSSEDQSGAPIILICRSGKRSQEAGNTLIADGLSNIYHVTEGFEGDRDDDHHRSNTNGWRYHQLPWEQC